MQQLSTDNIIVIEHFSKYLYEDYRRIFVSILCTILSFALFVGGFLFATDGRNDTANFGRPSGLALLRQTSQNLLNLSSILVELPAPGNIGIAKPRRLGRALQPAPTPKAIN